MYKRQGFRTGQDVFYLEEFAALGCRLLLATEDGSLGTRGFVTDCIRNVPECTYVSVSYTHLAIRSIGRTALSSRLSTPMPWPSG